jgi:putative thiamine transport system ATP-binding protein
MTLVLNGVTIRPPHAGPDTAPLFAPVQMQIAPAEVGTIMGPSGAGKSTLLDAIAGHLAAGFVAQGDIILNGQRLNDLPAARRRIGLMFQDALLFPHLSVGDNLAFGLHPSLRGRAARQAEVLAALRDAGLPASMAQRDPATLSGGERARVALMRSLLAQPAALLLDEPFSKLDAPLRADLRAFTLAHIRARAIPALMVTHDPADAAAANGPQFALCPQR